MICVVYHNGVPDSSTAVSLSLVPGNDAHQFLACVCDVYGGKVYRPIGTLTDYLRMVMDMKAITDMYVERWRHWEANVTQWKWSFSRIQMWRHSLKRFNIQRKSEDPASYKPVVFFQWHPSYRQIMLPPMDVFLSVSLPFFSLSWCPSVKLEWNFPKFESSGLSKIQTLR